jgi:hypothetical protein
LKKIVLLPIKEVCHPMTFSSQPNIDLLWHFSGINKNTLRPNWSGFMHLTTVTFNHHSPKSSIRMLPIIDLSPSDENCIFSTLLFVKEQAKCQNIPVPRITFDQPLWIKALEIVYAKSLKIVVRLGGFHSLMSFLGSVGKLMSGSGLEDMLGTVYGENTVVHMLSGKAFARALRGHFLVDAALTLKIMKLILPKAEGYDNNLSRLNQVCTADVLNEVDVSELETLFEKISKGEMSLDEVVENLVLRRLKTLYDAKKNILINNSRTAKLWINYMEYIDIVKMFIRAERTGNWYEHLTATEKMLNLFAATGHIHYAKSARLYLQLMTSLKSEYPWL